MSNPDERFNAANQSHNYCGICGRIPRSKPQMISTISAIGDVEHIEDPPDPEPNRAPLRWWDPDDGWKIGTLCYGCAMEVLSDKPKPEHFAYDRTNTVADDVNTDEDPSEAL